MTRGPRAQPPWGLTAPMPLPPVVSLVLAINRAERYPVAMGCCRCVPAAFAVANALISLLLSLSLSRCHFYFIVC
jgi:hypothetical protein